MAQRFVESHIRRILLFERLPDEQLGLVGEAFQVLRFEPGALVYRQGQPAQGLFYFVSGRGVLTHAEPDPSAPAGFGDETIVGQVRENEFVGEKALFTQGVETTSLRIVESAIVLFLSRHGMAQLLMTHPELRMNLGFQRGDQRQSVKPLFKGQRPDEVVMQVFKRHWWSYVRFIWIPVLIGTLLIVGAFALTGPSIVTLGMFGLALIIPAAVMYFLYVEWQDDAIIVTDSRVVRVQNVLLGLQNSLSEIPLQRVQEVGVSFPPADPFARMFNYGHVSIRTAGDFVNVRMTMVPEPQRLRTLIFEHRDLVRRSEEEQKRREVHAEIDRVLGLESADAPAGQVVAQADPQPAVNSQPGWSLNPLRTRFVNENGETVYRKHYTIWLRHVILPMALLVVAGLLVGLSLLGMFPAYNGPVFAVGAILFVLAAVWFYLGDWDWRNDHFVIGENKLVMIRKRPLWLQNEVDQVWLDKVDSVVSDVSGIANNLLNRGTVKISLIGDEQGKVVDNVAQPHQLQAEISQRQTRLRQQQQKTDAERQREAIAQYFQVYHQKLTGAEAQSLGDTMAREVSPTIAPQPTEPPPRPIRDGIRPPRIPPRLPEE